MPHWEDVIVSGRLTESDDLPRILNFSARHDLRTRVVTNAASLAPCTLPGDTNKAADVSDRS
ncbi:hypothetical protein VTN02DRAFT_5186 [Thermoascus thermophilus]